MVRKAQLESLRGSRDPFPTHTLKLRLSKSSESLCPPNYCFP